MVNRYLVLQKDVFDINKVTVKGSPTITSDGIASGFSTSNYLISSNSITINPNNFRINFGFTTGSNITTAQMIIRSNDGQNAFIIGLQNGKIRLYLQSATTAGSWDIVSGTLSSNLLTTNTKYNGYLSFNGSAYTLNINGSDWITVKSSALIRSSFALKIGQGMSAEPFLGSVNLQAVRVYSNNELAYSPTKPTYLLERRKPKVWNKGQFTIVGNPSISGDGVASGFSSGNYIKANTSSLDLTDNFELSFQITTSSDVTTEQSVWGTTCNNQAFVYQIINGSFRLYYPTGTGQRGIIDFGEVEVNKTYNITLSCKNGTLTIQNYNKSFSFLGSTITFLYIGSGRFENTTMFKGSTNLKQFKIYTDNTLVFDGGADTYMYDPSGFTIVGSPTITEYGVASGFSGSNYLQGATGITLGDNFKIQSKFTTGDDVTSYQGILRMQSSNLFLCSISNRTNSSRLVLGLQGINSDVSIIPVMKANTEYKILIECQNGLLTTYYSENNSNLTKVSEVENVNVTSTNTSLTLGNNTSSYFWQGSINLPQLSITVDGEEIFTGAKVGYYVLKK